MKADNGHMSDAQDVPAVALRGGGQMPMVGFGTWRLRGRQACESVSYALKAGYRHIDTASMYANEDEVGRGLRASGLDRQEVFITTKLRPADAGRERAVLKASDCSVSRASTARSCLPCSSPYGSTAVA